MSEATGPGTLTDEIYRSHLPPVVQDALRLPGEKKNATLLSLAAQGFLIDVPIMVWGWDAQKTMAMRASFGYTWVCSAFMPPIQVAPGISFPGEPPYDPKTIPPGAIKVSTDAADYPVWVG